MKLVEGQKVTYVDSHAMEREALVTRVFHGMSGAADGCNLVFVSDDPSRTDSYGQQIERSTSVPHQSGQPAHGNYWK